MSWSTDDGRHEGYLLPEFTDGVRGHGTTGGGVPDDRVIVDVEYVGEPGAITDARYTTRPAAEVVGWRIMCDCRSPVSPDGFGGGDLLPENERWSSDLIVRVPSKALEDLDAGRLHAVDEDVPYVDDDAHLDALIARWRREHVNGVDALTRVRASRAAVAEAERQVDAAVADARAAGESWEAIGRAAGMARQSAHARWGTT